MSHEPDHSAPSAHEAVEHAARECYTKVVAFLAARFGDLTSAQDAVGDAFLTALRDWPGSGIPDRPEAWMLSVARRKLIDSARRNRFKPLDHDAASLSMIHTPESDSSDPFPDERLGLLFACAHPAIDAGVRTPLLMNAVLNVPAARIASAFLVSPAAMSQRLTRAKDKIREARIEFSVPSQLELHGRIECVLNAVYGSYSIAWDDAIKSDSSLHLLGAESLRLARLTARLLPDQAEARGLLALMLFCESRRDARRDEDARYVPLSEQLVERWSESLHAEAEQELRAAARLGEVGRFQLEAAIQSAHMHRRFTGRTDWDHIAQLYEGLVRISPSVGALVGRAVAIANSSDASDGLRLLDEIDLAEVADYQPYWAARAELLARLGLTAPAREAYVRAIGLSSELGVRAFLERRAHQAHMN